MKLKKIFICIIGCMIVTGCTPEYNVTIENDYVTEKLIIKNDANNSSVIFSDLYADVENQDKYTTRINKETSEFYHKFKLQNYENSNMIKNCYESFRVTEEDETITLQTGLEFKCMPFQVSDFITEEYDNLKINIEIINYEVIENNADSIDKNVYTWTIDKSNYKNKPIILKIKRIKSEEIKESNKSNTKSISTFEIIAFVTIVAFVVGLCIIFINKKRNNI